MASIVQRALRKVGTRMVNPINKLVYGQFYNFPFGDKPLADEQTYRSIWEKAKTESFPQIDQYEQELGQQVDPDWFQNLALLTQVVKKRSDICYQHGRILYSTLRDFLKNNSDPQVYILETGTARGFSSICMMKALKDADRIGTIMTFDVLPHNTPMYWNCIADKNGPQSRESLLEPYAEYIHRGIIFHQGDTKLELGKVAFPRVHFAFLDGAHTYEYVLQEFEHLRDRQQSGDVIVFDDYTPASFPGIVKAVDEICARDGYEKRVFDVSEQRGYVVARKK